MTTGEKVIVAVLAVAAILLVIAALTVCGLLLL